MLNYAIALLVKNLILFDLKDAYELHISSAHILLCFYTLKR